MKTEKETRMARAAAEIAARFNVPAQEVYGIIEKYELDQIVDLVATNAEIENATARMNFHRSLRQQAETAIAAIETYLGDRSVENERRVKDALRQYQYQRQKAAD